MTDTSGWHSRSKPVKTLSCVRGWALSFSRCSSVRSVFLGCARWHVLILWRRAAMRARSTGTAPLQLREWFLLKPTPIFRLRWIAALQATALRAG
jgi:hypothetical protein